MNIFKARVLYYASFSILLFVAFSAIALSYPNNSNSGIASVTLKSFAKAIISGSDQYDSLINSGVIAEFATNSQNSSLPFDSNSITANLKNGEKVNCYIICPTKTNLNNSITGITSVNNIGIDITLGKERFNAYGANPMALVLEHTSLMISFKNAGKLDLCFLFPATIEKVSYINIFGKSYYLDSVSNKIEKANAKSFKNSFPKPLLHFSICDSLHNDKELLLSKEGNPGIFTSGSNQDKPWFFGLSNFKYTWGLFNADTFNKIQFLIKAKHVGSGGNIEIFIDDSLFWQFNGEPPKLDSALAKSPNISKGYIKSPIFQIPSNNKEFKITLSSLFDDSYSNKFYAISDFIVLCN